MAKVMRLKELETEILTTQTENTKKGLLGELKVLKRLRDNLPNNYTVIWQPTFLEFKPDILVIEPESGFIFLEVKNWDMAKVGKFYLNGKVETQFGIKNPLGQTQNYINELQKHVNSLSVIEKDIYRVTTSMVVYAGFNLEEFLKRAEVACWSIADTRSYLSRHIFIDELNSNVATRLLQSKKFKASDLASVINEQELTDLIQILGAEGAFVEKFNESKVLTKPNRLKQIPKSNVNGNKTSSTTKLYIFGYIAVVFLLIIFSTSSDFLYNYPDESEETSHEWFEENNYSDLRASEEVSLEATEEKVKLMEDMTEDIESIDEIEKESNVIGIEETSIVETETKEEVSILNEKNSAGAAEIEVEEVNEIKSGSNFTLGSTKNEVETIMGIPTHISTYKNEWGYQGSTIEFDDNDQVVGWTDYMKNLSVSLGNAKGGYFSLGSSKDEVVNAMGTPTFISTFNNEWGYGGSTIDFDSNDIVIGWTDFMENLSVSLGSATGSYFSLGSTKEEVVNAMGTPTSISIYRNEWGYGGSTIEFDENDVVIGWTDYLEKLRIK
ncbi:NERD domain-containing protein [Planococcus sp. MERTA32b]|nr:NERD domain-containing protein [Planococcus sp. MER TA 32b]